MCVCLLAHVKKNQAFSNQVCAAHLNLKKPFRATRRPLCPGGVSDMIIKFNAERGLLILT